MQIAIGILLLLAPVVSAQICGGKVADSNNRVVAGSIVKLVPFDKTKPSLTATTQSDGSWTCPSNVTAGRYLIQAASPGGNMSEIYYDIEVDAAGKIKEKLNAKPGQLLFRLPEATAIQVKSAAARAGAVAGAAAKRSVCKACPQFVDMVLDIKPHKADGTPWDAGDIQPELVMVVSPLKQADCPEERCRLPRTDDVFQRVQIPNFPGPDKSFRGCNAQVKFLGFGTADSLHCHSGNTVAFKAVPLPKRDFRVFIADIDVFFHDLVFEHSEPRGRVQCGDAACENQDHVSTAASCAYGSAKSLFFTCPLVVTSGYKVGQLTVVPSFDDTPYSRALPPTEVASKLLAEMRKKNTTTIPRMLFEVREAGAYGRWDAVFQMLYNDFEKELDSGNLRCQIDKLYLLANEYLMRTGPTGLGALDDIDMLSALARAATDNLLEDTADMSIFIDGLEKVAEIGWNKIYGDWRKEAVGGPAGIDARLKKLLEPLARAGISTPEQLDAIVRMDTDDAYKTLLRNGANHHQASALLQHPETKQILMNEVNAKKLARLQAKVRAGDLLKYGLKGLNRLNIIARAGEMAMDYGTGMGSGNSEYAIGRQKFMERLAAEIEASVLDAGYPTSPMWKSILQQRFREINDAFTPLTPPEPPPL